MNGWLVVLAIFQVLGIVSAIKAVMETRTAQGAIAWAVFLVTFPYVAVPAYWVFGRSRFVGYQRARAALDREITRRYRAFVESLERFRPTEGAHSGEMAERLAEVPFLDRNRVELLINGDAMFPSLEEGIKRAEKYILFQFYIVHDDTIGRTLRDLLVAKAKEGVKICFLYDEIGSLGLGSGYLNSLRNAGIEVHSFNTRKGWRNRFQLNFRNHRKLMVVDGKEAWIGGLNVGDEYLGKNPKIGFWRDTHVRIVGPAAVAAQLSFVEDWYWATGREIEGLVWEPTPVEEGNAKVLVIPSGPADDLDTAELMYLHAINAAKKRVWIASPYFVPDDAIVYALQLAGLRGVDVRILIPEKPDNPLVTLASYTYLEEAGKTGVKFYKYQKGFLHEKVVLIDDEVAAVGTANFDNRSFRLNFEITAVVEEGEFVREVERMFEDDFALSRVEDSLALAKKPFWFRFAARLARLTAPVQ